MRLTSRESLRDGLEKAGRSFIKGFNKKQSVTDGLDRSEW